MTQELQRVNEILQKLENHDFKRCSIFTNSLLKVKDTTEIIRDVRDEEVAFFQGKKMNDVDYEMINDYGLSNSDQYAQYEMTKLLETESDKIDIDQTLGNIISQVYNDEYSDDIEELVFILKRVKTVRKIWASSKRNMLDLETNQLLNEAENKIELIIKALDDVVNLNKTINDQKQKLENFYKNDQGDEPNED